MVGNAFASAWTSSFTFFRCHSAFIRVALLPTLCCGVIRLGVIVVLVLIILLLWRRTSALLRPRKSTYVRLIVMDSKMCEIFSDIDEFFYVIDKVFGSMYKVTDSKNRQVAIRIRFTRRIPAYKPIQIQRLWIAEIRIRNGNWYWAPVCRYSASEPIRVVACSEIGFNVAFFAGEFVIVGVVVDGDY